MGGVTIGIGALGVSSGILVNVESLQYKSVVVFVPPCNMWMGGMERDVGSAC